MSDYLEIIGGNRLEGEVRVSGAKNAALPLVIASVLSEEESVLKNIPRLDDLGVLFRLLESLGASVAYTPEAGDVSIQLRKFKSTKAPYSLVKLIRASFWLLGPILARERHAEVALPGGDAIGVRPVDIHLEGLRAMGAEIELEHGVLKARAPLGLKPVEFSLSFPSVGATHHLLMTAALTPGVTRLSGVAKEPEVVELASMLSQMGARISGAGTEVIEINGARKLTGARTSVLGDRVEAATYLIAAASSGGSVKVKGIEGSCLEATLEVLREAGASVSEIEDGVSLQVEGPLKSFSIETAPFPGVATDMQPLLMALACGLEGESQIVEAVFESRFGHVAEFRRFGAKIDIENRLARISGVKDLQGASVHAGDIRAAAALVILGLQSDGESSIYDIHHLDRGYAEFVTKLQGLGGKVRRRELVEKKDLVIGC